MRDPEPGKRLRLSIDFGVQKAGQAALAAATGSPAGSSRWTRAAARCSGLGSNPSYDPNVFAKGVRASVYKRLQDPDNGAPLANRATQGLYPTGSTFKLITATAALQSGLITPSSVLFDGGSLTVGGVTFKNAGDVSHGALALPRALQVSSDVFFYRVGLMADQRGGEIIQKWASRLGLGRPTGIDLPGEGAGLVPTPEWRNRLFRRNLTDRPWTPGDNINLAVGQGDLQADPLQMAVAYSAIANGGRIVTPHIGMRVEDNDGRILQQIEPGARRRIDISSSTRAAIMQGLTRGRQRPGRDVGRRVRGLSDHGCGQDGHGRARCARATSPGTSRWRPSTTRASWSRSTIERGGFGAEAAAPAARRILAAYFGIKGKKAVGTAGELARLMSSQPSTTPFGTGVQRFSEPRAPAAAARLAGLARDARPDRVQRS